MQSELFPSHPTCGFTPARLSSDEMFKCSTQIRSNRKQQRSCSKMVRVAGVIAEWVYPDGGVAAVRHDDQDLSPGNMRKSRFSWRGSVKICKGLTLSMLFKVSDRLCWYLKYGSVLQWHSDLTVLEGKQIISNVTDVGYLETSACERRELDD